MILDTANCSTIANNSAIPNERERERAREREKERERTRGIYEKYKSHPSVGERNRDEDPFNDEHATREKRNPSLFVAHGIGTTGRTDQSRAAFALWYRFD